MENTRVIKAMWKFIEDNGVNWAAVQKNKSTNVWMDVYDWSAGLGEKISPVILTSMYIVGLIGRIKDKAYYGNDRFHYFPITAPIH